MNSDQPSSKKPTLIPQIPDMLSGGGAGVTPAWTSPDLIGAAPDGIVAMTPQMAVWIAGTTTSVAGEDINLVATAHYGHCVNYGISMFTYGKGLIPGKPNQEVGIKLHAASGRVISQSQEDKTEITADKQVSINSTNDAVRLQAKEQVLATAGGAYIRLDGTNIEIHAPAMVEFRASSKSLTGPAGDGVSGDLPSSALSDCEWKT
jgi:type VI secretion system secreted protein VgrG